MVVKSPAHPTPMGRFRRLAPSMATGRWDVLRFTIDDVDALLKQGIVPEDATTELLRGLIVRKDRSDQPGDATMIGRRHRSCVVKFTALSAKIDSPSRHVESQQPIVCEVDHRPEPDFMVLRGIVDDYDERDASAADAFCIVEVSATTYAFDVGEKLEDYARAGIAQYVVVDLNNDVAEMYTDPDAAAGTYRTKITVPADGVLALRVGDADETFDVPLAELLP